MILADQRIVPDRRKRQCRVVVDRRVREIDRRRTSEHSIAVGPLRGGKAGWMQARCSCGSALRSRVQGIVEQWAVWHLDEAAARSLEHSA